MVAVACRELKQHVLILLIDSDRTLTIDLLPMAIPAEAGAAARRSARFATSTRVPLNQNMRDYDLGDIGDGRAAPDLPAVSLIALNVTKCLKWSSISGEFATGPERHRFLRKLHFLLYREAKMPRCPADQSHI
jgi:hypothetical protein